MTTTDSQIDRRTMLRATGAATLAAAAGCLGVLGSGDDGRDDVVLGPPENYDRRKDLDLPFPTYGEEIPEVSVPAPLADREISTTEFVGQRHTMLTFIYTSCTTVCPGLTAALRRVQADSVTESYADEMAFLPTTFDPEQDTADRLRTYGGEMGVNFEVGNWYFLRPPTPQDAKTVVEDTFGVAFESGEEMDGMTHFQHASLVLLVNKGGVVERAYNGGPPGAQEGIDDARAVVEGW
jgi:protein SCO1/2